MEENSERPAYEPELTEPPAPTPTSARYSALQRLWMVFTSPGEVFADIGLKPTWVLILILFIVVGVAAQLVVVPHIDTEATLLESLGDRADNLSEAQIENMVGQAEKINRLAPLFTIVLGPIIWAIMAAVFFVMLKITGSEADYVRTLATILHAYWPASVIQSVLVAVLIQRVGQLPQSQIANVVKANVGAFLSPESPPWLLAIAGSISIFNIWAVVLLVIGFSIVGKISRGKAVTAALVPWILYLVAKGAFAALTS
jgi:hypothetical protein